MSEQPEDGADVSKTADAPDDKDIEATQFVPATDRNKADDGPAADATEATQFVPLSGAGVSQSSQTGQGAGTWFDAAPSSAPSQQVVGEGGVHIGTLINNNYKVTEILSAGGMGEVYKGENVFTGDPVAIKVILDKLAGDEKAGAMFLREARTLSQLTDDAIVRYYNFVRDPGVDRFCLIMEFIEGVPLSEHVTRYGAVPVVACEALLKRLARGLEKAHRSGVIHRDLSLDNVMLPLGIIAEARLIDFGIAKTIAAEGRTVTEEFAGKFKFVAPEQLGHFGGDIGPRTDVYGLGLLVSAAVVGTPLNMGSSIEEAAQLRQSIPDLSSLTHELRPLVAHMLEPDPKDRPDSMSAVVKLLDAPWDIPDRYFTGPKPQRPTEVKAAISAMQTASGLALPPTLVAQSDRPVLESEIVENTGGGSALTVMAGGALLIALVLGGYAYSQDVFGADDPQAEQIAEEPGVLSGLTPRQPASRNGFLAQVDTGPCTYIARQSTGRLAGSLAGYATQDAFGGVSTAYEAQFNAAPAVQFRQITAEQCPVLKFARDLQGRSVPPVALSVDAPAIVSGSAVTGTYTDLQGRTVWLGLISPLGLVYPVTEFLLPPVQQDRLLHLPLQLQQAEDAPQLLLAVVTDQPLISTAQMRRGIEAEVVLPLILEEIAQLEGQGAAALAHVIVQPAPARAPDDEAAIETE